MCDFTNPYSLVNQRLNVSLPGLFYFYLDHFTIENPLDHPLKCP